MGDFVPAQAARYADEGYAAWLRFEALSDIDDIPLTVVQGSGGALADTAARELSYGLSMLTRERVGVSRQIHGPFIGLRVLSNSVAGKDGFLVTFENGGYWIESVDGRGLIYGVFAVLRRLACGERLSQVLRKSGRWTEKPSAPIRFLNHWDNLDGTIERGYAGPSIFYREGARDSDFVHEDLSRVRDYARLVASVGINGCSLNNVNADDRIYSTSGLVDAARLAYEFRTYGVQTLISVRLESPMTMGGLEGFDPCDARVGKWWKTKVEEIYEAIPDLAGLVLKADSEGRLGPSAYGRTHAEAANTVARALQPYGGLFFYRGFVYNHKMDWRDRSLDRAKAQYDNFKALDGEFDENVVLQIKNGPIDFQVREPVSPTFAGMEKTNTVIELMVTQEYLGQQLHTVYEVPWWKDSLDFDFQIDGRDSRTKDIVTGKTFGNKNCGFTAVCGVGMDSNWMGNHLAQANLYGYGRLTWDPGLGSGEIAREWTALTLSRDSRVVNEVTDLLVKTWPVYEKYTGHLGIGGLTDIIHVHYGPAPESSEHNGWGQWHRSDEHGTGMDRTVASGTGFTGQYPARTAAMFESLETCPEELPLFFHHVPYTHVLKSGKTVAQHIYDVHYEGVTEMDQLVEDWQDLEGLVDRRRFWEVLAQLDYQAGHARVWRDAVCQYFCRLSGIADAGGRVFSEPCRYEAEDGELTGYEVVEVEPWEAASGGKAVILGGDDGIVSWDVDVAEGWYRVTTWYFDLPEGEAEFDLVVDGSVVDTWTADREFPSAKVDAHTKTRRVAQPVWLGPGSRVTVKGRRGGNDPAAIDFLEVEALGR